MEYGKYKNARNASWQCILDFNINKLPVIVTDVIKRTDSIKLLKNSDVNVLKQGESGITIFRNNIFNIVYRDTDNSRRCRFTIAHELGHIFLGHLLINTPEYKTFAFSDSHENEANVFARDLLAPACILHELQAIEPEQIASLCNISIESATYRAERMKILEERNAFYLHPLERKVKTQFEDFISKQMESPANDF